MGKTEKVRGKRFWDFADVTVVHGFGYASKASSWVEAAFWLFAVGACIGLAIKDTVILTNTYMSQPTTTNIDVSYNETSTLALPGPVICIDAMLECLNLPTDNFTNASSEILTAFSAAPNSFNLSSLSSGAIATVIRMFSLMAAMEDLSLGVNYAGRASADYPPMNLYELFFGAPNQPLFYSTFQPLYSLRTSLGNASVNFTELTWQIGVFICEQFTPFAIKGASLQGICSRDNITWVGSGALRTEMCVRIPASFFAFTANAPQRVFAVMNTARTPPNMGGPANPSAWPDVYNIRCVGVPISPLIPAVRLDPGGERRYNTLSPDWVIPYMANESVSTSVAISAVYEAVSTKASPCSTTDTIAECSLRCKLAFFMTACNCYPISLFSLQYAKPAAMPFCVNLDVAPPAQWLTTDSDGSIYNISFSSCMSKNFSAAPPTESCLLGCMRECKTTTFTTSTTPTGGTPSISIMTTTITVGRWLYPSFQETLLMDASSFLASFGGSLGVWLGASLISLVHVPVYMFACALRMCRSKQKAKRVDQMGSTTRKS